MKIRMLVPFVLFATLAILFWHSLSLDPSHMPSPLVGKPLPDFKATLLGQTKEVRSGDVVAGKVTLMNVWASWCMSCYQEHEFILKLAQEKNIQWVGFNYKDETSKALIWLAQLGNPYHLTLADPEGKIGILLGIYNTPETLLIDSKGIIRYRYVGILNESIWKEKFEPELLAITEECGL